MSSKLISKIIVVLASICLLSGCASVHQYASVPYVGLDNGNFTYERSVECSTSFTYLFGNGGLTEDNLLQRLKNAANLTDGEVLVNVNIYKQISSIVGIYIEVNYQATADVVKLH